MKIACPKCRTQFRVPETAIGRKSKCPKCSTGFTIAKPTKHEADGVSVFQPNEEREEELSGVVLPGPSRLMPQQRNLDENDRGEVGINAEDARQPCPYCAEPIRIDAIKCRFCGELVATEDKRRATEEKLAVQEVRIRKLQQAVANLKHELAEAESDKAASEGLLTFRESYPTGLLFCLGMIFSPGIASALVISVGGTMLTAGIFAVLAVGAFILFANRLVLPTHATLSTICESHRRNVAYYQAELFEKSSQLKALRNEQQRNKWASRAAQKATTQSPAVTAGSGQTFGIIALILGLISLVLLPPLFGIGGIVLGASLVR